MAGKRLNCPRCEDIGWVCESHPNWPWEGMDGCSCGAPGAPCPRCNLTLDDGAPRMPKGFVIEFDREGWRH